MIRLQEGDDFRFDENTLTVNVARLRRKLSRRSDIFIRTKKGIGYLIEG